jgi:hypothetical protein
MRHWVQLFFVGNSRNHAIIKPALGRGFTMKNKKNANYEQKAIEALKLAIETGKVEFKNLERNGELDISTIEDQWTQTLKKMKAVTDEFYNDLVADVNEKELIAKKN